MAFWNNFVRAVGAIPHEARFIQGSSGIHHPVIATGIDSSRRRLVIISFESDARSAALMQADVQSVFKSIQLVVARPLTRTLHQFSNFMSNHERGESETETDLMGQLRGSVRVCEMTVEQLDDLIKTFIVWKRQQASQSIIPSDLLGEWERRLSSQLSRRLIAAQNEFPEDELQAGRLKPEGIVEGANGPASLPGPKSLPGNQMAVDPTEEDRRLGLCAVPIEDFSPDDIEVVQSGADLGAIQQLLRQYDLYQYFYPPPDQLALGLIDRGRVATIPQLVDLLVKVPDQGHPFALSELIPAQRSFTEMIDALIEHQFVRRVDRELEVAEKGATVRSLISTKPREALIFKLLNRLSATLSFKSSWLPILRFQK